MQIKWTQVAQSDLDRIAEYIESDNPYAATQIVTKILTDVETLSVHPSMGRPGRYNNTREFIINNTHYIVAYRLNKQYVEILRVVHGAMKWPDYF